MRSQPQFVSARYVQDALHDGGEIAFVDVREAGEYGESHPFFAVNIPYSRLEFDVRRLVPRKTTRVVLYGDGNELAIRAADRLAGIGYATISILDGGREAWHKADLPLFAGVNVPSKTFGELVERRYETPRITARELAEWQASSESLVVLDGRTTAEYNRMTIPGAVSCPNGELAYRWREIISDSSTRIVVNCAGRTRSIVGAQTLINLGLPNPVYALENGTQGWMLADLPLEHEANRRYPARVPAGSLPLARDDAQRLAERFLVPVVQADVLADWLREPDRTTYLFDVRTAQEYGRLGLRDAAHAEGGQLVQATDQYVGVRGSRLVLFDSDGVRAFVVAAWLRQMGWDVYVLKDGLHSGWSLRVGLAAPGRPPAIAVITAAELASAIEAQSVQVLDLRSSAEYRAAHVPGAKWSIRPQLRRTVEGDTRPIVFVADDPQIAELARRDLGGFDVRLLAGGFAAWQVEGRPVEITPHLPPDEERIDFLFFTHGRHDGNKEAARQYLAWETGLLHQVHPRDLATFQLGEPV